MPHVQGTTGQADNVRWRHALQLVALASPAVPGCTPGGMPPVLPPCLQQRFVNEVRPSIVAESYTRGRDGL